MKVELENVKPMEIEKRSFEIITEELGDTPLIPGTELIVKRCIHTSADFDYAKNLCFSEGAVEMAMDAMVCGGTSTSRANPPAAARPPHTSTRKPPNAATTRSPLSRPAVMASENRA